MSTEREQPYLAVNQPDGKIKIEGPIAVDELREKRLAQPIPPIGVMAKNTGQAILKVVTTVLNRENLG